jgi:hypothetical protein
MLKKDTMPTATRLLEPVPVKLTIFNHQTVIPVIPVSVILLDLSATGVII